MHGLLQLVFVSNKVSNVYILFLHLDTLLNSIICNSFDVIIIRETLTTILVKF